MGMKVGFLIKSLITVGELTRKWFLTCMDPLMRFQVEIERKAFSTNFTHVGFFASVNQHVALEFCIVKESFFTARMSARIQFVSMDSHVLLQGCSIIENLSTGF